MSNFHKYTCDWCGRESPARQADEQYGGVRYTLPEGWSLSQRSAEEMPGKRAKTEEICSVCTAARTEAIVEANDAVRMRCMKEGVKP